MGTIRELANVARKYLEVLKGTRRLAGIAVLVSAMSGIAEALGLVSILPLFQSSEPTLSSIVPVLCLLGSFLIAAALLKFLVDVLISRVVVSVEFSARSQLIRLLVSAPWKRVSALGQGELAAAIMSEATQLSNGVFSLLTGVATTVVIAILIAAAAYLSPSLIIVAAVFMLVSVLVYRKRLASVRDNEGAISRATTETMEGITGAVNDLRFMRLSGSDRAWSTRAEGDAAELARLRRRQFVLPSATRSLVEVSAGLFLPATIALTVALSNSLAIGLVFIGIFYRIIPRVQVAQTALNTAFAQTVWVDRWADRINTLEAEACAEPDNQGEVGNTIYEDPPHGSSFDIIDIQDVEFRYPGRPTLFNTVSLQIPVGDRIGLIGDSGSGKSTLIDLMLGLLEPDHGHVLINGVTNGQEDWFKFRTEAGIVPQDVPLRRGTLAENVAWDRPVNLDAVRRALAAAELGSLVDSLDQGASTFLSARTIGLSGGQRQRIGLARALYRTPRLLILDEATSGLDSATEDAVYRTIFALPSDVTIIVVSHRDAMLQYVRRVVNISNGHLIERGLEK